tara:strand:+ start:39 stop:365 length:327 start_codon:yes stop_codon:yes gene_type:complete
MFCIKIEKEMIHNRIYKMECFVCFETMENTSTVTLMCKHVACLKCMIQQMKIKNECPMCRGEALKTNDYALLYPNKTTEIITFLQEQNNTIQSYIDIIQARDINHILM